MHLSPPSVSKHSREMEQSYYRGGTATQGGLCRQKHHHKKADPKVGGREPKENATQTTKTDRNPGALPRPEGQFSAAATLLVWRMGRAKPF